MTMAWHLIERNVMVYRRAWMIPVSGFFEPVFYLVAMSVGVGQLVGDLPGPDGRPISYVGFVAPGLLAASAMNGALSESTFQLFRKLIDGKSYQGILATPVRVADVAAGEAWWSMVRGLCYSVGFLAVALPMGGVLSWWGVLAVPGALLICAAFAAAGQAFTSYADSFQDLELVSFVMMPLFLCSTTFFPLSTYPRWAQHLVQLTPLYHGVTLERSLTTGNIGPGIVANVAYLVVMTVVCMRVSTRQLERRLQQ